MSDQATELRKLVLRAMRDAAPEVGPAPRLMIFTGGQVGVGVTTMAVNLAVALAELGSRVILVDADSEGAGVATLCGLESPPSLADLLATRRDIHESLRLGPAGIQIIPGLWRPGNEPEVSSMSLERLMRQITKLGRHADVVLIDVGNGANDLVRRLAQAADDVVVVTAQQTESVMDAYARIKVTLSGHSSAAIWLLVNRCNGEQEAADVFQRINQSCQRFLGHDVEWLGRVSEDQAAETAVQMRVPVVLARPQAKMTKAIQQSATELMAHGKGDERLKSTA